MTLLTLGCATRGQVPAGPAVEPVDGPPSLAWAVDLDGRDSVLVGGCALPMAVTLDDRVDVTRIADARVVVVSPAPDPSAVAELLDRYEEPSLSNSAVLGREGFAVLARQLADVLPATRLEHLPPWAAAWALALSQPAPGGRAPSDDPSLQRQAERRALAAGVRVVRPLDVAAAWRADPPSFTRWIDEGVPHPGRWASPAAALCATNDPAVGDRAPWPDLDAALALPARADLWHGLLADELLQGGVFAVVDPLVLIRPGGLLDRLRAQGATVRPLAAPRAGLPAPVVPEQPQPLDRALLSVERRDAIAADGARAVCSRAAVRGCLELSEGECQRALAPDLALCVDASFSSALSLSLATSAQSQRFDACGLAGVVRDAERRGVEGVRVCLAGVEPDAR